MPQSNCTETGSGTGWPVSISTRPETKSGEVD
jgi:hypothetical protein